MMAIRGLTLGLAMTAAAMPALAEGPADRHAYFGDLHLHTAMSLDAYLMWGTRVTPDQAYRFARGEPVPYMGHMVQREWPLDFMAVTDHSEMMGTMSALADPASPYAASDIAQTIRNSGDRATASATLFSVSNALRKGAVPKEAIADAGKSAWQQEVAAANQNNMPGKFTTFIGYEWSSMADGKYNLHRNVIFRNDHAPLPFSSIDSSRPEDLWSYLENARNQGFDVIAIPHNGNASNGLMYDWNDSDGKKIDRIYAQRRALNEPLTEIAQLKGQSETTPEISANDEFSNFEVFDRLLVPGHVKSNVHGSYVREAYGRGLKIQASIGVDPFKYGVVGGTDIHNGLSTSTENAYQGDNRGMDPRTDRPGADEARQILDSQSGYSPSALDVTKTGSGGLTGVWAEENTRDSIFAALQRKETFATSGTRIRVRLFGGWGYAPDLLKSADWAAKAYAQGVPMGGDLPAKPATATAPRFAISAMKDPNGANLDCAQIVKVWLDGDGYQERIFDVALSDGRKADPKTHRAPPVGNTVDVTTASYKNTIGTGELSAVWQDPEFDAKRPAVYYLRVLEIPTPRWSTILAAKDKVPLPEGIPATIQERAWSSPIWYSPAS